MQQCENLTFKFLYLDLSAFYKHFSWVIFENLLHKEVVLKSHHVHKNRTFRYTSHLGK